MSRPTAPVPDLALKRALITAFWMVLACAALSISCRGGSGAPTVPTESGAQTATVSGLVFEGTLEGERPIAGVEFEVHALTGFTFLGRVSSNTEGRYVFSNVPRGTAIALASISGAGQQCVASAIVNADTVLDVELGATYPSHRLSRSPTLSGFVFERTAAGRQPIPNASVSYDWDCGDGQPEAGTRTDAGGHYELCRLPRGGCLDFFLRDGRSISTLVDVQRDTELDIEVPVLRKP
jgi:hypothetical protein